MLFIHCLITYSHIFVSFPTQELLCHSAFIHLGVKKWDRKWVLHQAFPFHPLLQRTGFSKQKILVGGDKFTSPAHRGILWGGDSRNFGGGGHVTYGGGQHFFRTSSHNYHLFGTKIGQMLEMMTFYNKMWWKFEKSRREAPKIWRF